MITEHLPQHLRQFISDKWDTVHHPEGTFVRFWSVRSVQIDGELTLPELRLLVEIMEALPSGEFGVLDKFEANPVIKP